MERMTPDDAAYLALEDEVSAMHSVTIAILSGPKPDFTKLIEFIDARIPLVPRFRQRYLEVPFELERPVWVDDPHFKTRYHIRHTGLPDPTPEALNTLVGRILSQRLDRGKPLWEVWIVSGLQSNRWAIISKAHHSIIDGVSGIDPMSMLADDFVTKSISANVWDPGPLPSQKELIESATLHLVTSPKEQMRMAKRLAQSPRAAFSWGKSIQGRHLGSAHRSWARASVSFKNVRRRRKDLDRTTNDVLLTHIALGLRALNLEGEVPHWPGASILTHIPYAVGPGGVFTNEVSTLSARLPLDSDDFGEVAKRIAAQVAPRTNTPRAVSAAMMADRPGLVAPTIAALGTRRVAVSAKAGNEPSVVAVNAPGPRSQVSVMGSKVISLYSAVPLSAKSQISVGIISYRNSFHIGIATDASSNLSPNSMVKAIRAVDSKS